MARPTSLKTILERERDFFKEQLERVNIAPRPIERAKGKVTDAHESARSASDKLREE